MGERGRLSNPNAVSSTASLGAVENGNIVNCHIFFQYFDGGNVSMIGMTLTSINISESVFQADCHTSNTTSHHTSNDNDDDCKGCLNGSLLPHIVNSISN